MVVFAHTHTDTIKSDGGTRAFIWRASMKARARTERVAARSETATFQPLRLFNIGIRPLLYAIICTVYGACCVPAAKRVNRKQISA